MDKQTQDDSPDWLKELEAQSNQQGLDPIIEQENNPFWFMVVVGIVVLSLIVLCFAIRW